MADDMIVSIISSNATCSKDARPPTEDALPASLRLSLTLSVLRDVTSEPLADADSK